MNTCRAVWMSLQSGDRACALIDLRDREVTDDDLRRIGKALPSCNFVTSIVYELLDLLFFFFSSHLYLRSRNLPRLPTQSANAYARDVACMRSVVRTTRIAQRRLMNSVGSQDFLPFGGITICGLTSLFDGVRLTPSRIRVIRLCGTPLGDKGADMLARCLRENESLQQALQQLDLSNTGLTDEGLFSLLDALQHCAGLTHALFAANNFGVNSVHYLIGLMEIPSLQTLNVCNCGLSSGQLQELEKARRTVNGVRPVGGPQLRIETTDLFGPSSVFPRPELARLYPDRSHEDHYIAAAMHPPAALRIPNMVHSSTMPASLALPPSSVAEDAASPPLRLSAVRSPTPESLGRPSAGNPDAQPALVAAADQAPSYLCAPVALPWHPGSPVPQDRFAVPAQDFPPQPSQLALPRPAARSSGHSSVCDHPLSGQPAEPSASAMGDGNAPRGHFDGPAGDVGSAMPDSLVHPVQGTTNVTAAPLSPFPVSNNSTAPCSTPGIALGVTASFDSPAQAVPRSPAVNSPSPEASPCSASDDKQAIAPSTPSAPSPALPAASLNTAVPVASPAPALSAASPVVASHSGALDYIEVDWN
eukprot:m.119371 g.119371  ORF g.119371 m.119371 type:complete len:589 (+) comp9254_c0_seq3:44-1810(+)